MPSTASINRSSKIPFSRDDTMEWIVTYDISENDVRGDVSDYLISMGFLRIQKSVFSGKAKKAKLKEMKIRLGEIIADTDGDVLFIKQCKSCLNSQFHVEPASSMTRESKRKPRIEKQETGTFCLPPSPFPQLTATDIADFLLSQTFKPHWTVLKKTKRQKSKRRTQTQVINVTDLVIIE